MLTTRWVYCIFLLAFATGAPIITNHSGNVSVIPGDNAMLTCSANAYPAPRWSWIRADGFAIDNGDAKYAISITQVTPQLSRTSLTVFGAAAEKSYTAVQCEAKNNVGTASATTAYRVHGKETCV